MAYATVGMVTDYDCWLEDPTQHVVASALFELYNNTLGKARTVLDTFMQARLPTPEQNTRESLSHALLSDPSALSPAQTEWLKVLQR